MHAVVFLKNKNKAIFCNAPCLAASGRSRPRPYLAAEDVQGLDREGQGDFSRQATVCGRRQPAGCKRDCAREGSFLPCLKRKLSQQAALAARINFLLLYRRESAALHSALAQGRQSARTRAARSKRNWAAAQLAPVCRLITDNYIAFFFFLCYNY